MFLYQIHSTGLLYIVLKQSENSQNQNFIFKFVLDYQMYEFINLLNLMFRNISLFNNGLFQNVYEIFQLLTLSFVETIFLKLKIDYDINVIESKNMN